MKYLVGHGGEPAPPPSPFSLSSLFLKDARATQVKEQRTSELTVDLFLGGLVGILAAGVLISWRWRGRRLRGRGWVAIAGSTLLSGSMIVGGLATFTASCYAPVQFWGAALSKAERLALLERAVQRGEVPPEVARLARETIQKLP